MYRSAFLPFGPEEIKEESSAEDGGYCDANEDVVRSYTDKIIIVHGSQVVQISNEFLLVNVF